MFAGQLNSNFRDLARLARVDSPTDGAPASAGPSRISLLPSVRLPNILAHRDAAVETPATDKDPILTLEMSSHTLIDCTVADNHSESPLYTIRTTGACTTVTRNSSTGGTMQFATIRWPKVQPTRVKGKETSDGVEIQMGNNRYLGGGSLLKYGSKPSSARKFQIPNYSSHLKWKRRGDTYWCTTPGLKGPIATLDPGKDKQPIKLTVYETLRDKYDSRSVLYHQGIYILLLDYLIVTSILLLTDVQEWMVVRINEEKTIAVPEGLEGSSTSVEAMTSQWRKILYREPIYPKLGGDTLSLLSTSDSTPSTPSTSQRPRTNHSSFSYRSSMHTGESMLSLTDSEDEDDDLDDSVIPTRPGSMAYPSSISHAYIDSSFGSQSLPPVPPLPLQYARSNPSLRETATALASSSHSSSSTASSPVSKSIRGLPRPPSSHSRSHTSPLSEPMSRVSLQESGSERPLATQSQSTPASTSSSPVVGRTRSLTTSGQRSRPSRPLPTVPTHAPGSHHSHQPTSSSSTSSQPSQTIRRARSHATLSEEDPSDVSQDQRRGAPPTPFAGPASPTTTATSARSMRSLPPTPISLDPASPRPEVIQEELKVAAATVHMLRSQHQAQQQHYAHRQRGSPAPVSRRAMSPLRKTSITGAGEEDDEGEEGQSHWMQVLGGPAGGELQSIPDPVYEMPPPAYSEN